MGWAECGNKVWRLLTFEISWVGDNDSSGLFEVVKRGGHGSDGESVGLRLFIARLKTVGVRSFTWPTPMPTETFIPFAELWLNQKPRQTERFHTTNTEDCHSLCGWETEHYTCFHRTQGIYHISVSINTRFLTRKIWIPERTVCFHGRVLPW